MKGPTLQLNRAKPDSVPPLKSANSILLQRKCGCGGTPGASGECEKCRKNRLQRKLAIGASNDPLELEADRIADHVMSASSLFPISTALPRIQRLTSQSTEGERTAPDSVNRVIGSSGRPMDPPLRQDMEQRFGHDFSSVRIHSNAAADQSAQDVDAKAYTVGNNIVFGKGRFAPETSEGRRLIAHELTHVVQQNQYTHGSPGAQLQREPNKEGKPPSLSPRERQVACVVRRGGCTTGTYSRDAGIADAHLPEYNRICKDSEKTGYDGPPIKPSPEECKNPPKEPLSTGAQLLLGAALLAASTAVITATLVAGAAALPVVIAAVGEAGVAAGAFYFANAIVINEAGLLIVGLLISCEGNVPGLLKALADDPIQAIPILAEVYILHTSVKVSNGPARPATIPVKLLPPAEQTTSKVRFKVVGPPQFKDAAPPSTTPVPSTTPKAAKPAPSPVPSGQVQTNRPPPKSTSPEAAPRAAGSAAPDSVPPKVDAPQARAQPPKEAASRIEKPEVDSQSPKPGAPKAEGPETKSEPTKSLPSKPSPPEAVEETPPPAKGPAKSADAAKPAKPPGEIAPDDPQRGVKTRLQWLENKIAVDQADLNAINKKKLDAQKKAFDLRKKKESTPPNDPNKTKVNEEYDAALKEIEELEQQHEHGRKVNDKDRAETNRLRAALEAKTYARPTTYRAGLREEVWENAAKDADGNVPSPSGAIKRGDPWVMGHKPKYEFWKHQRDAAERGISREQFIKECNEAKRYRPETKKDNDSHMYEDKTDAYLGN